MTPSDPNTHPDAPLPTHRRFHLRECLGRGAYGEVYLAEQESGAGFRRQVAIKFLQEGRRSTQAAQRMRDEARILGRISHRSVVQVLDLARIDGRWAVVMEPVPGTDLEGLLDAAHRIQGAFPPRAAAEVGSAVASALHTCFHTPDGSGGLLEIIHRDIKPANIRLTPDGDVKVLDFGIAKIKLEQRESETGGSILGTLRYMSPERIAGRDKDSLGGDIYALAKVVSELIIGDSLERSPTDFEEHEALLRDTESALRSRLGLSADAPSPLIDLLLAGLAYSADQRPDPLTFSDELADLAGTLDGETLRVFARRFVPEVHRILGIEHTPVSGVLSEDSLTSGSFDSSRSENSTLLPDDLDPDAETDVIGELPPPLPTEQPASATPLPLNSSPSVETLTGSGSSAQAGERSYPQHNNNAVLLLAGVAVLLLAMLVGILALNSTVQSSATPNVIAGEDSDAGPSVRSSLVAEAPAVDPAPSVGSSTEQGTAPVTDQAPVPEVDSPAKASEPSTSTPEPAEVEPVQPAEVEPVEVEPAEVEPLDAPDNDPSSAPAADTQNAVADADLPPTQPTEPVTPPPVSKPAEPEPVAAPSPAPKPPMIPGVWAGDAGGRPFVLRITSQQGVDLVARGELTQGTNQRSLDLFGTVTANKKLTLESSSGMSFVGTVSGTTIRGEWRSRPNAKPAEWTVKRQ